MSRAILLLEMARLLSLIQYDVSFTHISGIGLCGYRKPKQPPFVARGWIVSANEIINL